MKSAANAADVEEKRSDTTVIEGNLSNDEKREKKTLLVLKRSVRGMKSAAKVKRTVPGKAHEERQHKFHKLLVLFLIGSNF